MELSFSRINGTNRYLDYERFEQSIRTMLEPTCKKAEVIILNNFPVSVTPHGFIDFLLLLDIPKLDRSWYRVESQGERYYVKNQIIAVTVFDEFYNSNIVVNQDIIEVDDAIANFEEIPSKIKWGLTNYLSNHCGMERRYITVHPMVWLKNKGDSHFLENIFIGKDLDYKVVEEIIARNTYFKWPGYKNWHNNEILFEHQIQLIFEQASKDSVEGYITKKKVDRFQRKFGVKQDEAFAFIGEKLVEVRGKAGSGKTSELLKWMLQNSRKGKRSVFLTYNHLLVYDISYQIKSFNNREYETKKASSTTNTLHGFFYNVARKLGVLLLLSEKGINELTVILDDRLFQIEIYFDSIRRTEDSISLAKLLMYVQSKWNAPEGLKREAILLLKYIENCKFLPNKENTSKLIKEFHNEKITKLSSLESSNVFLKDYHNVLERIFQATNNLDAFLTEFNVENKFELLSNVMNLKDHLLLKNGRIDFEKLKTRYRKGISGFSAGRTIYVDEAQDCHPLERDIIFKLFGPENCVIANEGKEQLIRYSALCNWQISQAVKIETHIYQKSNKSFRMKPAIAALANHVAKWYDIDLNIEPIETEDHGQIFISTSNNIEDQINAIDKFCKIGERQGCTNYESLLIMATGAQNGFGSAEVDDSAITKSSVRVNEHNNIVNDNTSIRSEWGLISRAQDEIHEAYFWNATGNVDKRQMTVPGSLSIRSIYYESCRGLEAWSTMCFGLDSFFDSKVEDDEADNFLLSEIIFDADGLKRREMYAATWVLMALTRCIENCYLQLVQPQSSLYECIMAFTTDHPDFVRIDN